jgi:apolipoprotein N-acyltransferase
MKPKHVLGMLLAFTLLAALIDARETQHGASAPWWALMSSLIFSFLCFCWYRLDSEQRQYRRTVLLNVGVIALAAVAIPYYVVRSRPPGQKGRALLRFGGFVLLLIAVSFCGALL